MVSAQDIPWALIIFVFLFAIVLFYFIFFQSYLTAAIYRCIIKCFLPKNLILDFKRIQFSFLSGHLVIHDLIFANLSMRVEIKRLCVALKYWSKIPDFNENDDKDDKQNAKDINNVEWIRSSHEDSKDANDKTTKKKKGIFKTVFDRKSRFKVNIDGLHVILYNQSEDAISRIEMFRQIYGSDKKSTEEATEIFNQMFPSPPPQPYQLPIFMRVILPMTFKVRSMLVSIGNPNLPSVLFISSKKIKGLFTMLKKEDPQHSHKQRLTFHMTEVKIRSVPNEEFDKNKFIKNSMRCLQERFEIVRTILYTDVLNVIYTQDAFGCYIRSEDKDKALLVTAEPKTNIQIGLMNTQIEYGSYVDKLRSAFMRYFKPFLFLNPVIYPVSYGRVKYMDITMSFFGEKPAQINLPFATSQGLNESLILTFDNKPESIITMSIPQYVSTVEENKMEVICNFVNPKIRTSLSDKIPINLEKDEGVIIKSSTLLVYYISFSPERWYEEGITKCMISFERCKMKIAPYHIDLFTDLGTDFVATYPFEPAIDKIDYFQPSNFYVSFKMVDAKIQLLSKANPRFEDVFRIRNHQRMVIKTPMLGLFLQMPSKIFHEYEKNIIFQIQIVSPTFKFFLPNDNMNQFRRNCYKWAHDESDKYTDTDTMSNQQFDSKSKFKEDNNNVLYDNEEHTSQKYIKHEYLGCSSINMSGSYNWNNKNGNKQLPLVIKIGPSNGLVSVVCIKSLLGVISNYSSSTKSHPNTDIHNKAFDSYVKPEPEFPDSVMHMQLNVQIVKADVGIPFDLYDTSAYISLHASNFYLAVESNFPFFHVLIDLTSISITFNKTHFPSERFYYERIGDGMIYDNPSEVVHVNGLSFAIKNCQVSKPKAVNLFSLMKVDIGDISGTISVYQLFAMLDLALNFVHLWFSFNVPQQTEPDLDSIFLPRQMQVSIRAIFLIVDFVQYGLMLLHLPSGIIVYQDNLIRADSHKAMFINIPTIDVHHIYQPSKDDGKTKKKRKRKVHFFKQEKSSSSHNKVVFLIDSTTSTTPTESINDFEYEEEEEEEEEKKENVAFLSQLRSVFHVTTYISIIRRETYKNYETDSKIQMRYINDYDPNHIFFDFSTLPKNIKLPKIFNYYEVTLDEEYTLTKTMKPDPNKENLYELPIHEIFFTNQNQYIKADVSQLWLHLFQTQRFSSFGAFHIKSDLNNLEVQDIDHFYDLRKDMHVFISPKTTALMNMEYIIVLMLMVKTFNLQPDSHFLSTIARDVDNDLWLKQILKNSNISLILPGALLSLSDFNREVKVDLSISNISLITLKHINVSNQMTLSISDISLNAYSKNDPVSAACLSLPSINIGKIDGDTSVHFGPIIGNVPVSSSLLKIVNYSLSYLKPIFQEMESPGVDGNLDDFMRILEKYINDDENMDIYYNPEAQNDDNLNENNISFENDSDEDSNHHHRHHHKADKVRNHLPKFHIHHKKKKKSHQKDVSENQLDESTGTFMDKESVIEEEKNTSISRYFLAYAKLCINRKSLVNFVDNYQFDMEEEEDIIDAHTIYVNENDNNNDNNNIRGNFTSQNYQNLSLPDADDAHNNEDNNNNQNDFSSDNNIKIKNEKEKLNKSLKIKRTIIKFSKIQFNFLSSVVHIKLDPISLISKGKDSGIRIVIKSIQAKINSDAITFLLSIKKPKKDDSIVASKKFEQKRPRKIKIKDKDEEDKRFIIHFILDEVKANIEYFFLIIKSLSALANISTKPYLSLSLMNLVFGDNKYVQVNLGGFDFNYSKRVNHGSFCLKPIGIKVAIDLVLNPSGCIDLKKFKLNKIKKRHNYQRSQEKIDEKIKIQNEKTDKLIKSINKFNQSETKNSINEILQGISFFLIMKEINIEAMLDESTDQTAIITFPGARAGVFNTNNFKAFLYLMKPEVSVTNFLSISLIDIYMYGYYQLYPKKVNLYTTSGDLKVKSNKDTLTKIASFVNNLLSKRPKKEQPQESPNRSRQLGRKSVANISLINRNNSSSSVDYRIKDIKIKAGAKSKVTNLSNNALKVVNSISDGISLIIKFTIPSVIFDLPEIASTLNISQPSLTVECQQDLSFIADIKNLNLLIDRSSISINMRFVKENEEKAFTMNDFFINVTPSLFHHLIRMKEFYISIKTEFTRQENIGNLIKEVNKNIQISVKNNFIKIFDAKSFSMKSTSMLSSNQPGYEVPTITSDKYTINLNNTVANLKLTDEEENAPKSNHHHHRNLEGFVLAIPSILLCLETRMSELHSKTATAVRLILKNLNFEDKNEKSKGGLSSVNCEEANISLLSFVSHINTDVIIKSFHISLYPTAPFIFSHVVSLFKTIQKDIMTIKTAKIMTKDENISDKKKIEMMKRRGSLNEFTPKSSAVTFNVKILNTAVILHSPQTEFAIPSLFVIGDFEKTNSTFSPQKIHSTVHIKPIQMSITPSIIKWINKLIKNIQDANLMMMVSHHHISSQVENTDQGIQPNKPKKVLVFKFMINLTVFLERIEFNLGCQPSDVMLLFTLSNLVTHFTTKSNCASFQVGEISLTTEKADSNKKTSFMPPISSYRQKYMSHSAINEIHLDDNGDRLLSIRAAPIDGLISREIQAFSINSLSLSVSNNEMEDLFTFLKVWFEPIMGIVKELTLMFLESRAPNETTPSVDQPTESENKETNKKIKTELNIVARVQTLSISFSYSGVNGKIGLEIKPILFSNTKLSTILTVSEILVFATGFVEGTVEITPFILQINSAIPDNSELRGKRLNSAIIIKSITSNIKSYSDPLLSFSLNSIYLFFLLIPPSFQILSLVVDSPKLKMTSQAIAKFKRIVSSIMDPIKEGILKTKLATVAEEKPQTVQPNRSRFAKSTFTLSTSSSLEKSDSNPKLKVKKKIKIEKARLDLLLEKLQVELYKYYITDKEAAKVTVSRASLTVDLYENQKQHKNLNYVPEIIRNMNFVFKPMALLRLFCKNGLVVDKRSVLSIPQIIGSLNTIQKKSDVLYDFNTKFEDSVEASLTISDYEAVMAIVMFAIRNIKGKTSPDADEDESEREKKVDKTDEYENDGIIKRKDEIKVKEKKKKREFIFKPNNYSFSPQFKIALGAKIQPNVEWVLQKFGITDEHVVPATLFQFICLGLQDLLEYIAQTVASE